MEIRLYHVSNPVFRNQIKKEGLRPQIGASYEAHYEDNHMGPVIFVCKENNYNSTYDDDRYEIILSEEEYRALDFQIDEEVDGALYTKSPIPAKYLCLIHKGSGEDYDWELGDICNNISKEEYPTPKKNKKKKSFLKNL